MKRLVGRGTPMGFGIGLVIALLVHSSPAGAQVTGDQAVAVATASKSPLPPDSFGGLLAFGRLDEDFFITLALRLNFDRENWGVGFQVPVRFRLIDNDPEDENDFGGIVRREDWDELSDFLRVIRYVYVGQPDKKGPFYARIGELAGTTIGHGTIMYRYYNGVDADVWHTGLNAAVNVGPFGAEAVIGDVVDPYVVGGRVSIRPLELVLGEGLFWEKLVIGASVISDLKAPTLLETTTSTPADGGPPVTTVQLDSDKHPRVANQRGFAIIGVDVGIELLSNEIISITPYVDFNKMTSVSDGWGLHAGILWGLRFPLMVDTLTFDARTEYRYVSGDYVGPYFNTTYEIERYQLLGAAGGALPLPKLGALIEEGGGGRNGVFFDLLAGLPSFVFVGGEYIDYDGGVADGTLRLSLEVPALEVFKFSAFYYRINISGMDDLFKLDDRSAIVAQAAIPIYYVFSLNLRWWRVWQADPANNNHYEAVDDWSVGVGFSLEI